MSVLCALFIDKAILTPIVHTSSHEGLRLAASQLMHLGLAQLRHRLLEVGKILGEGTTLLIGEEDNS